MSSLIPVVQRLWGERKTNLTAFGLIAAACRNLPSEGLEAMKSAFGKTAPDVTVHYAYDKTTSILCLLLERQKLGDTHFHALQVKAYLLEKQLLSGGMLVASFAESSAQMSARMLQDVKLPEGFGEIQMYAPAEGSSEGDQARIMLVGPDQTVNEFLTIYLKRKGYQVSVAKDGMEGMQKFQEVMPDLVITDLNLPVLSGYQLMERITHAECERASKIVVLTDKRLREDVQKSFALGASDYITKPFSPVDLEARVKRLIS